MAPIMASDVLPSTQAARRSLQPIPTAVAAAPGHSSSASDVESLPPYEIIDPNAAPLYENFHPQGKQLPSAPAVPAAAMTSSPRAAEPADLEAGNVIPAPQYQQQRLPDAGRARHRSLRQVDRKDRNSKQVVGVIAVVLIAVFMIAITQGLQDMVEERCDKFAESEDCVR